MGLLLLSKLYSRNINSTTDGDFRGRSVAYSVRRMKENGYKTHLQTAKVYLNVISYCLRNAVHFPLRNTHQGEDFLFQHNVHPFTT